MMKREKSRTEFAKGGGKFEPCSNSAASLRRARYQIETG
jgi:hypothetical protein